MSVRKDSHADVAAVEYHGEVPCLWIYRAAISFVAGQRPTKYGYPSLPWDMSCRYDGSGNLFLAGFSTSQSLFLELLKGSNNLTKLSLHLNAYIFAYPILWDGSYITLETGNSDTDTLTIYRISVSGSAATVVGKTNLHKAAMAIWIQDGSTAITGRFPTNLRAYKDIEFYDYPAGKRQSTFDGLKYKENQILDLAVAIPPSNPQIRR